MVDPVPSASERALAPSRPMFEALDAATRAIAGVLDVEEVLQVIVDQVRPLVGAEYAALGIVDDRGVIERFITSGMDPHTRTLIGPLPRGHGMLGLIIQEDRAFRIPDIATDPRRHGFPPHHPAMHEFLGVPVHVQGRSVGNLYLTNRATPFTAEDENVVEVFARHAGIAIENARLHDKVRRLAVVDERERISTDLHDSIIQSLYAIGLSLEDVEDLLTDDPDEVVRRVERAIDGLHLTIRDIRNFIFGLRPELLGGTTLAHGLAALVEDQRHHTMVDLELSIDGLTHEPNDLVTQHLLGITSEALSNIARHAAASRAWIEAVTMDDRTTRLIVRDNGRGFQAGAGSGLGHQGLTNLRSRAAGIGAQLDIHTAPGAGTTITVTVPDSGAGGPS